MAQLNLVFVSALQSENGSELPGILHGALAHNPSQTLRSMLLFAAGSLMQVIEGEAHLARQEMQRLFSSPDYVDPILLNEVRVSADSLADTSLGALHLPAAVIERVPSGVAVFSLTAHAVDERMRPGIARNLMRQFAADYS